ncbi:MAG: sensor N-terminal transmembrane domain-containing protein, partial [Loktanella sp.]|nr:sensor N-terminal transmembrane domain-containing protein [Loktanella sp.]
MTAVPKVDVRDLKSVRRAARAPDVVLGEDWVAPEESSAGAKYISAPRRGFLALSKSPIARKIVMFNLIAMTLMIAGLLYLNSSRDSLIYQRASGLVSEAQLIANVFEARLPDGVPVNVVTADGINPEAVLSELDLRGGVNVSVFAPDATLVAQTVG